MSKLLVDAILTRKVAELARLDLTDVEAHAFAAQLESVIEYVDRLQELDVSGVEPLVHPLELETPLREDVVVESPGERVLACAPEVLHNGFKVPQVL